MAELLECSPDDVARVSGKTGDRVEDLIRVLIKKVPPPEIDNSIQGSRGLIFDFSYSEHRGVTMYIRVVNGTFRVKDSLSLSAIGKKFQSAEVGVFTPEQVVKDSLETGEIGYVVSGIKEPGVALVGDTLLGEGTRLPAFPGYQSPRPVVWASLYPQSQGDFTFLKQALTRLRLSDAALSFEEDGSSILGKGFRLGFLGMLHLEIIAERLKREFDLEPIITSPSIAYEVTTKNKEVFTAFSPSQFPEHGDLLSVREQWADITIIVPPEYLSGVTQLLYEHEAITKSTDLFSVRGQSDSRIAVVAEMPLRELMRGFFDKLKSVSSGFASLSYEFSELRPADIVRLDILVGEEIVPAFSRIVSRRRVEEESRAFVEKLYKTLPRQLFVVKIQASANGKIIASRSLSAIRKDVTGYLYGGDITRKKKLLEKQKKGKERRGEHSRVTIPQDVFLKMVKSDTE